MPVGSIVLIVLGILLVGVGIGFAWINKATDKAGGSGLKSISVEGPAWLVLVVVGLVSIGFGTVRIEDRGQDKNLDTKTAVAASTTTTITGDDLKAADFPNGFTFGDNNDLDKLWRECERGAWASCDDLYFQSDPDSDYEYFGATCGDLFVDPELWCDQQRNIDEGLIDP
jgi:hypothetical protein